MAVQENDTKDLRGKFENEILSELEIVVMPYKLKGKVRMEVMNDKFAKFAISKGIINDDLIDNISWRKVGELLSKMVGIAQEFYEIKKEGKSV